MSRVSGRRSSAASCSGTYALSAGYRDAYYIKAQKVRTLIKSDFDAVFEQVDAIVAPTSPSVAFPLGSKTGDPVAMYLADACTLPVNVAGLPACRSRAGSRMVCPSVFSSSAKPGMRRASSGSAGPTRPSPPTRTGEAWSRATCCERPIKRRRQAASPPQAERPPRSPDTRGRSHPGSRDGPVHVSSGAATPCSWCLDAVRAWSRAMPGAIVSWAVRDARASAMSQLTRSAGSWCVHAAHDSIDTGGGPIMSGLTGLTTPSDVQAPPASSAGRPGRPGHPLHRRQPPRRARFTSARPAHHDARPGRPVSGVPDGRAVSLHPGGCSG